MGNNAGTLGAGLVVGLVVGLGGGFLLFGSGAPGDGLGGGDGGLGGAELTAEATASPGADPLTPSSAPPAPAPIVAPSGGFDSFQDALDAATADARRTGKVRVERGDGKVTGRVMTDDGTALSGVVIRATRSRSTSRHPDWRPGDGAPPVNDLDRRVRERVAEREQRLADTLEAVSDAAGRYTLTGLVAESRYQVKAFKRGYQIAAVAANGRWGRNQSSRGQTVRAGTTLDLLALAVTVVRVTLEMPDGAVAKRAMLTVQGTHPSTQPWIPRDATLRLPPGSYKIVARVDLDTDQAQDPAAQEYTSDEVALELLAGTPEAQLSIPMKAKPGLAGRVTGFGDDQRAYIQVKLLKLDPGVTPDKETLAKSSKNSWPRGTNPVYRFKGLTPGRYLVGAGHQHGEIEIMQEIDVSEGMSVVNFDLKATAAGESMTVLATGPNGRPVGAIEFWLSRRGRNNTIRPRRRTRTDSGGHLLDFPAHTFTPKPGAEPQPNAEPPGPWVLYAKSPLYGQTSIELSEGQREVSMHLRAPAKLIVSFPGYAESGLKGYLTLTVTEPKSAGGDNAGKGASNERWMRSSRWRHRNGSVTLDANGDYTSGPLEPGPREISVMVSANKERWGGMSALPAYKQSVTLVSGDNRIALRLPATHELNVQVELAEGEKPPSLQLQPADEGDDDHDGRMWFGNGNQADANGIVTFKRLPPGRYRIVGGSGSSQGQMHVVVPAQQRIRFIPEANDAMQAYVKDPNGLLGAAGLESGDKVIDVDGKPFADAAAFTDAVRSGGTTVVLGYLRKGKPGTATVDREALTTGMMSGQGMGGGLSPTPSGR